MTVSTVFYIYFVIGASIGFSMLKTVLDALKDEELQDESELDYLKDMINKFGGLQRFVVLYFITITLFWAPVAIQGLFADKDEE